MNFKIRREKNGKILRINGILHFKKRKRKNKNYLLISFKFKLLQFCFISPHRVSLMRSKRPIRERDRLVTVSSPGLVEEVCVVGISLDSDFVVDTG